MTETKIFGKQEGGREGGWRERVCSFLGILFIVAGKFRTSDSIGHRVCLST